MAAKSDRATGKGCGQVGCGRPWIRRERSSAAFRTRTARAGHSSGGSLSSRKVTAMAAVGQPTWSVTAAAIEPKPGRHLPVFGGVAALPDLVQMRGERRILHDRRLGFVPGGEGGRVGVQRPDLRLRQRGEDGAPARGEVARQPHPDVGHQRGAVLGPLLHDVEHIAAVQHGEVGAFADRIHERGEQRPAQARERLLPRIRRAEFEGTDPQPVALLLVQVQHKAVGLHHAQQVVDAGARQPQRGGNVRRRHRPPLGGQQFEDAQGIFRRRNLGGRLGRGGSAAPPRRQAGCCWWLAWILFDSAVSGIPYLSMRPGPGPGHPD